MKYKLNILYDMVQSLEDELQTLKTRVQLKYHDNYERVCVTSSVYNEGAIGWERVNTHRKGICHNSNEALNLARIHQEIMDMKKAVPSWSAFTSLLNSIAVIRAYVLLPIVFKLILNSLQKVE